MTIECYYKWCPHHEYNQQNGDDGPFCYQPKCLASEEDIRAYQELRKAYLADISIPYTEES